MRKAEQEKENVLMVNLNMESRVKVAQTLAAYVNYIDFVKSGRYVEAEKWKRIWFNRYDALSNEEFIAYLEADI